MKTKKLNLNELRIENFVIELNQSDVKSIKGGGIFGPTTVIPTAPEPPFGAIGSLPLIIGSYQFIYAPDGPCQLPHGHWTTLDREGRWSPLP